jgi:aminoglycoside phosphotransferase family enzyme/predicted kinase
LPEHIKALLEPSAYPSNPGRVELRQSHVSYLLFTPEFVYKIKKPVNFGFLDFTSLDKRRFYCEEEVRLNRRLAPEVYLGVVGITGEGGRYLLGGEGEPMEYAVKMRRLSEELGLGRMLAAGAATEELIRRISHVLAAFHKNAATSSHISGFGSLDVIGRNTGENFSQTEPFIGKTISQGLFLKIKEYTNSFIAANAALLEKRAAEGFIRDCHGDIHSEHVFAEDGIEIIDCIEFNERFRFSDVVADEAFLSMDLDYHNRHDLSEALDKAYFDESGDREGVSLLNFYKCYRAYVRGKVESFKAFEEEVGEQGRSDALLSALYHFYLSGQYASGGVKPMLLIICGLPGTGKSTLAGAIAERTGFVHLASDVVRKELAGLKPIDAQPEQYGEGIYSEHFTERTYAEVGRRAFSFLNQGRSVITDATFSKRRHLKKVMEAADMAGAKVQIIECSATNATVRARLEERRWAVGNVSDADWRVYLGKKVSFEEVPGPHIKVAAERTLAENLREVFRAVFD